MRFWLARGVDGFRVDVIWHLIKDAAIPRQSAQSRFPRRPAAARAVAAAYTTDQPEVHDVVAEMRRVIDEFDDRVLIGEIYLPIERLVAYYGSARRRASAVQFRAAVDALERARDREDHRRLRARAAAGRLAELGARQSRPAAGREPGRDASRRGSPRCCC